MGLHHSEEFRHHRGDAGKVMGPSLAFPSARERRHRYRRLEALVIHALGRRFKTDIHPFLAAEGTIVGNRAGICREVFGRAELCRVHEDTHDECITT